MLTPEFNFNPTFRESKACHDLSIASWALTMTNDDATAAKQEQQPLAESLWDTSVMANTVWGRGWGVGGLLTHSLAGCGTDSQLSTRRFCSLDHGDGPSCPDPFAIRCSQTWVGPSAVLPHVSYNNLSHHLSPSSFPSGTGGRFFFTS